MNKKIVLLDARGGALGDEICIEPIARYVISMGLYDVRILSGYPQVFKHLNCPIGLVQGDITSNDEKYTYIPACPRHMSNTGIFMEHPFASFAQPLLCHPVDFVSLFMLRRMLPDKDKRPILTYSQEAVNELTKLNALSIDVAFHIGATEKCRAFPQAYTQKIVDDLETLGIKVAIFGKTTRYTPEVRCNIDLVDKLDLDMLFAFIAISPIVLTNDSAPIHIAAAFNTYLLVVPTIRHPDRLLHVRNGSRYHNTRVLFKKLMFDDLNLPLENIVGDRKWSDVENRREEFLPEPHTVLKNLEEIMTYLQFTAV